MRVQETQPTGERTVFMKIASSGTCSAAYRSEPLQLYRGSTAMKKLGGLRAGKEAFNNTNNINIDTIFIIFRMFLKGPGGSTAAIKF